jgi:hypothetical protein
MPFTPRFTITNPITAALTAIERARGFLEAATLSDEWIERMSQRALLLEAHHTTHIEGTELTLDEAARVWAGEEVPGASRDDVRELDMDLTGWVEFFVHGLAVQMDEVKSRGAAIIRADVVAKVHKLGARQAAVLAAIHEAGMLSLGELEPRFSKASRRSLQRDLRLLLDKGLIQEGGSAAVTDPNRSYIPVPEPPPGSRRKL